MKHRDEAPAVQVDHDPFAGGPLAAAVPATAAQQEIWTASQISPEASCAFNQSIQLKLEGPFDADALAAAAATLAARHEALRGSFTPDGQMFCIAASGTIPVRHAEAPAGRRRETLLEEWRARETAEPFDLGAAPLARVRVLKLEPEVHVLFVTAHHVIADGWSMGVILNELAEEYSSTAGFAAEVEREPFGFSQYTAWLDEPAQRTARAAALDYWKAAFETGAPVLDLPTDHSRPPLRTFECDTVRHDLDPAVAAGMKRVGAASRCTFFVTMLAAYAIFLRRISGQSALVVGVPAAGQAAAGRPQLVGHCTNVLPLKLELDGEASFADALKRVKAAVLDAFEHQQCTFTEVLPHLKLATDFSRVPLIPVTFNVDRIAKGLRFGGMDAGIEAVPRRFDTFEWTFNLVEFMDQAKLELTFNTGLFARHTMQRRLEEFERLAESIVAAPQAPIAGLDMLGAAERSTQISAWNETQRPYPEASIPGYLKRGFGAPGREAVSMGDTRLSYGELEARSNRLARHLRAQGSGPGVLVGLSLERSPEMLVALLGILKSGAAYLPLDPAFPAERIAYMLEDSGARLLVTDGRLLAAHEAFGGTAVCIDRDAAAIDAESAEPPEEGAGPQDRAYVIYTSGSTGRPKGVQVTHANVVNFLHAMAREPGIAPDDRLLAVTTLSFDIAVLELMLPLSAGATVVMASRAEAADGLKLREVLESARISMMQATPSTWRLLLTAGWQGGGNLRMLSGGEALPRDLAQTLFERSGELWNMYGPTETTVWSTCCRIGNSDGPIPVGRPIDNTRVYVLDEGMRPLPLGVYGELYIGGAGVTIGYLNRPELTAERFVEDPFVPGGRLYRTGDRVRYRADGSLEYHSRVDNQVKVRGFRIEPGEIETALSGHAAVHEAAVVVREDQPGDQRLVAYYVVAPDQSPPTVTELRSHLRGGLPDYMLPQHFCELPALPRTPNNKVDRNALPDLSAQQAPAVRKYVEPETDTEQALAALWRDILRVEKVGAGDNFFELGGHSLGSVRVIAWAKRTHGIALHPLSLVTDSLARVAREIDRQRPDEPPPAAATTRASFASRVLGGLKATLRPSTT